MIVHDVDGERIYEEDFVRQLAAPRRELARVISVTPEGKVMLATGVITKPDRLKVIL